VDLKYSTTSRLYLTDTSNFGLSDFGRPRNVFNGTIDFSCFCVNGWASGSAFAAIRILRSSSALGTFIFETLDVLDIVFHLASRSVTKTADPAAVAAVNEGDEVEIVRLWREGNHPHLVILNRSSTQTRAHSSPALGQTLTKRRAWIDWLHLCRDQTQFARFIVATNKSAVQLGATQEAVTPNARDNPPANSKRSAAV
jgi:hypothetical protein